MDKTNFRTVKRPRLSLSQLHNRTRNEDLTRNSGKITYDEKDRNLVNEFSVSYYEKCLLLRADRKTT